MHDFAPEHVIALFAVLGLGLALGRIKVFGLSLDRSGVVFAGLACGAMGFAVPNGAGHLGLVLFCYAIGITAGPSFFRSFRYTGAPVALLVLIVTAAGAAMTYVSAKAMDIPADLAVGVYAGALSSTPALAADNQALGPGGSGASVSYGLTILFGVVGVVLFMQIVPKMMRINLNRLAAEVDQPDPSRLVSRVLVEVVHPDVVGLRIDEIPCLDEHRACVTRIRRGDRLVPVAAEDRLNKGDLVYLVARTDLIDKAVASLGRPSERHVYLDLEHERRQIVVLHHRMINKPLNELNLLRKYGITLPIVTRHDVDFVPQRRTRLRRGDIVTAVGDPDALTRFAENAGHRTKAFFETDLISLSLGIGAGVALGMVSIPMGNGSTFELGMAGGPLVVGLLLGHFGRVGPIVGYLPRAARMFLLDLGLVVFLAAAGVAAGGSFFKVLFEYGPKLVIVGAVVTVACLVLGYAVSRYVMKMNLLQMLGALCAAMTSTPGLGAVTTQTDSGHAGHPLRHGLPHRHHPHGQLLATAGVPALLM